jgi:uncharacterized protein YlzI (FlbEa/FlbD family)
MLIKSQRFSLELVVNNQIDLEPLQQYLPSCIELIDGVPDMTLEFVNGNKGVIQLSNDRLIIETKEMHKDVLTAASRYLEHLYFRDGCYSVHSAAFSLHGKAVLLPGRSGAGKTTVLLDLLLKNADYDFISADRTVIEKNKIIAGTTRVNMRGSSIRDEIPAIQNQLKNVDFSEDQDYVFSASQLGFNVNQKETPIFLIVYPQKENSKLRVKRLPYPDVCTRLANQSFYFLEEFPRILFGANKLVPCITSEDLKNQVLKEINHLTNLVDSYAVSGRLEDITEWVSNYCKKGG